MKKDKNICPNVLSIQKKVVPLHSQFGGIAYRKQNVAAIAQLVEHDLAKVGVASSSLVCRSFFFDILCCPGGGMVDALVSGASVERRAGSSPVLGTTETDGEVAEW